MSEEGQAAASGDLAQQLRNWSRDIDPWALIEEAADTIDALECRVRELEIDAREAEASLSLFESRAEAAEAALAEARVDRGEPMSENSGEAIRTIIVVEPSSAQWLTPGRRLQIASVIWRPKAWLSMTAEVTLKLDEPPASETALELDEIGPVAKRGMG
jgi:hypothetical protein